MWERMVVCKLRWDFMKLGIWKGWICDMSIGIYRLNGGFERKSERNYLEIKE